MLDDAWVSEHDGSVCKVTARTAPKVSATERQKPKGLSIHNSTTISRIDF